MNAKSPGHDASLCQVGSQGAVSEAETNLQEVSWAVFSGSIHVEKKGREQDWRNCDAGLTDPIRYFQARFAPSWDERRGF